MGISRKLLEVSKLVEATELAELITNLLGNKIRLELIEIVAKEIGYTRLAELANSKAGSIKSSLNRGSIGDDLAFRIFKGLAQEKPHLLRFALEKVLTKYGNMLDSILEKAREREKEVIVSSK